MPFNNSDFSWSNILVAGLAYGVIHWVISWVSKKHNIKQGYDIEQMDVEGITKAWLKGALMQNQILGFYLLLVLFLSLVLGLIFGAIGYYLIALVITIGVLGVVTFFAFKMSKGKVALAGLDEQTFQAVGQYFQENKAALIAEVSKDPDVAKEFNSWSAFEQKFNVRLRTWKSFKPVRGPEDV